MDDKNSFFSGKKLYINWTVSFSFFMTVGFLFHDFVYFSFIILDLFRQ